MDPVADVDLLWIAEEALTAALPGMRYYIEEGASALVTPMKMF